MRTIPPDELSVFWKVRASRSWYLDLPAYRKAQATYAGYQTYGVAITLIKISVLLFYRRIFATPQFRLRTNIVGALVLAWLLINNLLTALQCRPIKKAWSPLTPGHCIEPLSLILGLQAGNVALDITILALPIFAVSKLQMSLAKKISVLGIFLLGGLQVVCRRTCHKVLMRRRSIVIAIIRIGVVASGDPKDVTCMSIFYKFQRQLVNLCLGSSGIDSWTAVEPAIEVLSVCLPTMAPFLHGHKAVQEIRAAIRSALSLPEKSSSMTDNAGKFQKMEDDSKMFDLERNGIGTFTRADHQTRVAGDAVALHMIRVTDQVDVYLGEGRGRRGESC